MKITSTKINSTLLIPTSKSYANRALILGALSKGPLTIDNIPKSQDTKDLISVLSKLGVAQVKNESVVLAGSFPANEMKSDIVIDLNLGEGGTTIRFLLPLLALGKQRYKIKINPSFKKRPYQDLFKLLRSLGVSITELASEDELCILQGPIRFKPIQIDCSKTSQVASAFILLQSVSKFDLHLVNILSSQTYIDMTNYLVEKLIGIEEFSVPIDMSSASYFIALALFTKETCFPEITSIDKYQADSCIFKVCELIGGEHSFSSSGLRIIPCSTYKAFEFDISQCLDLAPTLAFIASNIEGKSILKNIGNLRYKESDRVESICNVLTSFDISHRIIDNCLEITGRKIIANIPRTLNLAVANDHRVVMMASLFLKLNGGGDISPAVAVEKSFANFFLLINGVDTIIKS